MGKLNWLSVTELRKIIAKLYFDKIKIMRYNLRSFPLLVSAAVLHLEVPQLNLEVSQLK